MNFKSLCSKSALSMLLASAITSGLTSCSSSEEVKYFPVLLERDGHWGMLDITNGKLVFTDEFKEQPTVVSEGIFAVMEGEHAVLYKNGATPKALDTPELLGAGLCREGLIPVSVKSERIQVLGSDGKPKFDLMPVGGKEIVECSPYYADGWLAVKLENGEMTYVDTKGNPMGRTFVYADIFNDGYAMVTEKTGDEDSSERSYLFIDKKGQTVLKYKSDWTSVMGDIVDGKTIIRNANDIFCVVDLKGNVTKLPGSVSQVTDFRDGLIVFVRDGETGVMTEDGEVIIRPKYESAEIVSGDKILVQKSSDNWLMLDKKGNELFSTDEYNHVFVFGKSLIGRGKRTFNLLDQDGKLLSKEDFFGIGQNPYVGSLTNNYFNMQELASTISSVIAESLETYKFGATAPQLLAKEKDATRCYNSSYHLDDFKRGGFLWESDGYLLFSSPVSLYDVATQGGVLNDAAILTTVVNSIKVPAEYRDETLDKIVDYLKEKGFKVAGTAGTGVILANASTKLEITTSGYRQINIRAYPIGAEGLSPASTADMNETDAVPAASTSAVAPAAAQGGDFTWLSQREVTAADLQGLSKAQCRLLRNAIFAMHGYKFKSKDLSDYFSQFPWYSPRYSDVNSQLSAIEHKNIDFIKRYE